MFTYMGKRVIENRICDNWPRMQLSPKFAAMMPFDWVTETNNWMRDFFGTEHRALLIGSDTIAMGPKGIAMLRAALPTSPEQSE